MANTLKTAIKHFFEKFDFYFRIRYSKIYLRWYECHKPVLKKALAAESKLYAKVLQRVNSPFLIFDIGANEGYNTAIFQDLGTRVISVEPDRRNQKALKARFRNSDKVMVVDKAISDRPGSEIFHVCQQGSALNTLNIKWKHILENPKRNRWQQSFIFSGKSYSVQTTTLDELIQEFGKPYFIKIDTEGYEEKALIGLSHKIPLISFEANLPEFLEESLLCIEHLKALDADARFNYAVSDRLELTNYEDAAKFKLFVQNTQLPFMDIFCKMGV